MKIVIILTFLMLAGLSYSQDSYKKRYYVKESYLMNEYKTKDGKETRDTIRLKKITKYNTTKNLEDEKGKDVKVAVVEDVDFSTLDTELGKADKESINGMLKSNLKFVKDTIYVNHWPYKFEFADRTIAEEKNLEDNKKNDETISDADQIYFLLLKNRQPLSVKFRQWSLNVLSTPLKIRFGETEEFTTGANLGAFFGPTFGKTTFVRRNKVDNKEYNSKWTIGLFLGADKLEFSYGTGVFVDEKETEKTVKTSFLSIGSGLLYSREKFTVGALVGLDYGLGKKSNEWDYQGKPWLGISLGYNLFSF